MSCSLLSVIWAAKARTWGSVAAIGNNQRRTPPSIPASFLSMSRRAVPTPPLHPSSCTASGKPGAAGLPLRKETNMEGAPLALPAEAAGGRTGSAGRAHLRPGSLSAAPRGGQRERPHLTQSGGKGRGSGALSHRRHRGAPTVPGSGGAGAAKPPGRGALSGRSEGPHTRPRPLSPPRGGSPTAGGGKGDWNADPAVSNATAPPRPPPLTAVWSRPLSANQRSPLREEGAFAYPRAGWRRRRPTGGHPQTDALPDQSHSGQAGLCPSRPIGACLGGPRRPGRREGCSVRAAAAAPGPAMVWGAAAMNGAVPSLYDPKVRVLKLGESFEKQPRCAFHTVRCECWGRGSSRGLRGSGGVRRSPQSPEGRGWLQLRSVAASVPGFWGAAGLSVPWSAGPGFRELCRFQSVLGARTAIVS